MASSSQINEFLETPEDSHITAVPWGETPYISASNYEDLNLPLELLRGLYDAMKFQKPSKIQAISLPMILTTPYKDLIAQAHNGSGKTTCCVLGMLSRVDPNLKATQALYVCPTKELAIQNIEVLQKMATYTGITAELAVPKDIKGYVRVPKEPPVSAQVVIGTPATVMKWMWNRKLNVSNIKILVFDEADHMLAEDGFKDDSFRIKKAIDKMSSHCQVLLFSATFNETVKNFVSRIVKDYNQLFVNKVEPSLKQYKVHCPDQKAKTSVIKERIFELGEKLGQTIIFVRTKKDTGRLHKELVDLGCAVTTIQGAVSAEDTDKIVQEFKNNLTKVLITTDSLLALNFVKQQVDLVINYDLPVNLVIKEPDYEVYLNRIGWTGRFGRKGAVFNLLCNEKDKMIMTKIEQYFCTQVAEVESWDSNADFENALKAAGLL